MWHNWEQKWHTLCDTIENKSDTLCVTIENKSDTLCDTIDTVFNALWVPLVLSPNLTARSRNLWKLSGSADDNAAWAIYPMSAGEWGEDSTEYGFLTRPASTSYKCLHTGWDHAKRRASAGSCHRTTSALAVKLNTDAINNNQALALIPSSGRGNDT